MRLLAIALHPAECEVRGTSGFDVAHAHAAVVLLLHLHMKAELLVPLLVQGPLPSQLTDSRDDRAER